MKAISPRSAPDVRGAGWDRQARQSLAGIASVVLLLNVLGWGVLLLVIAPREYSLGSLGVFGAGLGATAFLLGVRHALDVDHIAAIDNTTRKLVGEGRQALGVGFWFALGHSSVVFGLSLLLALGVRAIVGPVQDEDSQLQQTLNLIGTLVAGAFLLVIGLMNLQALLGIISVLRRMRSGTVDEDELERHLSSRGFMARLLAGAMRRVNASWHMFPVGLLMGLGFDTATQVALLVLAAGSAAFVLPWYAILVLPVLFAAGMTLVDSADGVFMARAYGWAFLQPVRKIFYNLTVTLLSVVAALFVGFVVLLQALAERLNIESGPLGWAAALELRYGGILLVGLFAVSWLVALAVWRLGRFEARWSASLTDNRGPSLPDEAQGGTPRRSLHR